MSKLTTNFWDADTGEFIEIKKGKVVARHQSILSNEEKRRMKAERSAFITNRPSSEEPLVQPKMFEETKKEIILEKLKQQPVANTGPLVMPELTFDSQENKPSQDEPLVMPKMEF